MSLAVTGFSSSSVWVLREWARYLLMSAVSHVLKSLFYVWRWFSSMPQISASVIDDSVIAEEWGFAVSTPWPLSKVGGFSTELAIIILKSFPGSTRAIFWNTEVFFLLLTIFDKVRLAEGRLAELKRPPGFMVLASKELYCTQRLFNQGSPWRWTHGLLLLETRFLNRFCGPLKIDMVVLLARSMNLFLDRKALIWAAQKPWSKMNFVPKQSTTLNFKTADRDPKLSEC